jgi:hypothetical protein
MSLKTLFTDASSLLAKKSAMEKSTPTLCRDQRRWKQNGRDEKSEVDHHNRD